MAAGALGHLALAAALMQEEEEEYFELMMVAARLGANDWMEMEEGIGLDDESWQHVTVNIEDYHNMNDRVFRLHFRMHKEVFGRLVETIEAHLVERGRSMRQRTPLRDAVLMVVWLMATPDTFRSVALRFGVTPSTLYYFYSYIIQALREMAGRYIHWPNEEERQEIKGTFLRAAGFPGVIGSIDGTHVYVTAPVGNAAPYRNRYQSYSILVQAVVDNQLLVRDLYVGEPGSLNDNRVFRRSDLCNDLIQGERLRAHEEHLVGDGAYTLSDYMMIPFPHIGLLNEQQRNFNRSLSQCRVRVEHSFGRAKGKWRRLKFLHVRNHEIAVDHITASFVLHNFIISEGEGLIDEDELRRPINNNEILGDEQFDIDNEDNDFDPALIALMEAAQERGHEKRLHIMAELGNFQ